MTDPPPCVCPLCDEVLSDDEPCARVSAEAAYGRYVHGTTVAVHPDCKAKTTVPSV